MNTEEAEGAQTEPAVGTVAEQVSRTVCVPVGTLEGFGFSAYGTHGTNLIVLYL